MPRPPRRRSCSTRRWTRRTGNPPGGDGAFVQRYRDRYDPGFLAGWDLGRAAMLTRWGCYLGWITGEEAAGILWDLSRRARGGAAQLAGVCPVLSVRRPAVEAAERGQLRRRLSGLPCRCGHQAADRQSRRGPRPVAQLPPGLHGGRSVLIRAEAGLRALVLHTKQKRHPVWMPFSLVETIGIEPTTS